jgi:hypothetical protein
MSQQYGLSAPVVAPQFQNRRSKTRHLKNSFPAGFYNKKVTESDVQELEKKSATMRMEGSFMESFKGLKEENPNYKANGDDPWESCAGPYLQDIMRHRQAEGAQSLRTVDDKNAGVLLLETKQMSVHVKSPQKTVSPPLLTPPGLVSAPTELVTLI